jgi:hypothetical protein
MHIYCIYAILILCVIFQLFILALLNSSCHMFIYFIFFIYIFIGSYFTVNSEFYIYSTLISCTAIRFNLLHNNMVFWHLLHPSSSLLSPQSSRWLHFCDKSTHLSPFAHRNCSRPQATPPAGSQFSSSRRFLQSK